MKARLRRHSFLLIALSVIFALTVALVCLSVSVNPAEADEFTPESRVVIAHISDTHYYAFRMGYVDGPALNTDSDDYYYNYVMEKCTKMWLEGELIFDAGLTTMGKTAKALIEEKGLAAGLSCIPDYMLLSGDVAQDGELIGHVDVANKLRQLQNYIRSLGKTDFQIFVVLGNHDLYNPESWRFDNEDGEKVEYYYDTRIDAVQIFAGLGYPNMTESEAAVYYAGLTEDGVLPTGYEYVRSDLSSSFEYRWQFIKDDGENIRTYRFGDGAGEYAADDVTFAKLYKDQHVVRTIDNATPFGVADQSGEGYSYSRENFSDVYDLDLGEMTTLAKRTDGMCSIIALDVVQSNAKEGHVLGGQLHFSTWDWLDREDNKTFLKSNDETLIVATCHHSVVPHWDYEEEITTGFILYNWKEAADYLADYGVRYVYTGHQHANDAVGYVSNAGNQIIDMESAAHISVGSQIKWTTIERGRGAENKYAEKAYLDAYGNIAVKANESIGAEFIDGIGNVQLYEKVFKNDKYGYIVANQMNTTDAATENVYINHADKEIINYGEYAQHRVYENVVDNYLNTFLRPEIVNKLGDLVSGISFSAMGMNIDLSSYSADVVQLANNLIKGINDIVLADYTYQGPHARLQGNDVKIFAYAEDLVYRIVNTVVAEDADILETFLYAYMAHSRGSNVDTFAELPAKYQAVLAKVKSGEFVDTLFNQLLDRKTGLMRIIVGLCENTFDLSTDISNGFKNLVNSLLSIVTGGAKNGYESGYDYLKNFNLGDFVAAAGKSEEIRSLLSGLPMEFDIEHMTVPEIIDDIVDKYLTDNFKQGLGEYAYNIVVALAVDGDRIDVTGQEHALLKVYQTEEYTYIAKTRTEVVTVDNGKLPSMITNVFGSDPKTTRNFTFFTDRRVNNGAIQYTTDVNKAEQNVVTKDATTERYGMTKGLIDLGIWCQAGYYEASRHTVELTGLTANTTYYYRLTGDKTKENYWSEWYTFKTGRADGFEVLIASDLQASTESSYQRIDKIYQDVLSTEFANGIDFLINPGDVVDNSRNATQFKWFLNSSVGVYTKNATVVVAGNHDNKYFDVTKASNVAYYAKGLSYNDKGKVTNVADVETGEYNFLLSHYDYDLTAAQAQKTGFYYSFDYAGVHFTMLNTNDIDSENKLAEDQYDWLVDDLKNSTATYKVVVMHKSLYSEGSHSFDKDVVGMRAQLTPVFSQYGVNLVLAGHDHTYNETFYLDGNGNKINTDANGSTEISSVGTLYVTMGTMGEKFYNYKDNGNVPTQTGAYLHDGGKLSDPTFGKLVLKDGKLYYQGYQYVREMSQDGYSDIVSGEAKEIVKGAWKEGLSVGAIVGISVGCVAGAAIVACVVFLILKKKGILFAAKAAK